MQLSRSLFAAGLIAVLGVTAFGLSRQHAYAAAVSSGDLVRGTTYSAVYYIGEDGFRYVFPNQKTYDTWYSNFNTVKFISDAELSKIQIGGNVTYKPGSRMIKIDSDPKTYAVDAHGTLRHVSSEAVAISLYGSTWNKQIDDVPDGFFTNYTIGSAILVASDYSASDAKLDATSINVDMELQASKSISVTSGGYSPIDVTVDPGQGVKFTNNDTTKHTATADDLSWGTGTLNPGDSFTKKFSEPGTYTFFDSYDSSNTGAVIVGN
jgi:plastocyanin